MPWRASCHTCAAARRCDRERCQQERRQFPEVFEGEVVGQFQLGVVAVICVFAALALLQNKAEQTKSVSDQAAINYQIDVNWKAPSVSTRDSRLNLRRSSSAAAYGPLDVTKSHSNRCGLGGGGKHTRRAPTS